MKYFCLVVILLSGCTTNQTNTAYYETVKSLSRDKTMIELACWNAVVEIGKIEDAAAKMASIAIAKECRSVDIRYLLIPK